METEKADRLNTDNVWSLPQALAIAGPKELIAIVGGGGKSSLMFALGRSLPGRVIMTTTTRIFAVQIKQAPTLFWQTEAAAASHEALTPYLAQPGRAALIVGRVEGIKAEGVPATLPAELLRRDDVDAVLVEADGSRRRPVKAPAAHEPVIPPETTLVIPVAGLDALDRPLAEVAHRPELVARLLALDSEPAETAGQHRLAPADIAALLAHPQGGLKGVPPGARVVPFINKVETEAQLRAARKIAQALLPEARIERVVLGAVRSQRPVWEVHRRAAAVVLAAGEARRMGRLKQLLPWEETTVLGYILRVLKETPVSQTLVVAGHEAEAVSAAARAEGADVLYNPHYAAGEMLSSLQAAVRHYRQAADQPAAILVLLADQPMITPAIIEQVLAAYWQGKGELIAPVYKGQRGHPVLFGAGEFAGLMALPENAAPRDLLQDRQEELYLVPVDSPAILRDLDHPDDYRRWRR